MKILNIPTRLYTGDYLVQVDYETISPGYGKDIKDTVLSREEIIEWGEKISKFDRPKWWWDIKNDNDPSEEYKDWLKLREESKNNEDEPGFGICYCGHTSLCECSDPGYTLFKESIERGVLDPQDPKNIMVIFVQ